MRCLTKSTRHLDDPCIEDLDDDPAQVPFMGLTGYSQALLFFLRMHGCYGMPVVALAGHF